MKKVILVVRDGWGYSQEESGNAVRLARTSNHDHYLETYPWTLLKCTGNAIGVPEGTQGGSEPGHLTMGAGRIVWQPLSEINRSIADGGFYSNEVLLDATRNVKAGEGRLHLMGLHSDQGIHGTTHHLYALLELARRNDVDDVYIHCFLDGRDVPERSAKLFLEETMTQIKEKGVGRVASLVGRYYAMDRDTNWWRVKTAYDLLTLGKGRCEADVFQAIERSYQGSVLSDYYLEPIVMTEEDGSPVAVFEDGDSVVFWNFRSDRARQLTYALTEPAFEQFHRCVFPRVHFTCMSVYDRHICLPVAFPQREVENNLGQVLSDHGLKQLRIAETEKYAHVTFFFNSQVEDPNPGEDRILVPSPKVPSYEEKPEMSTPEITERLVPEIRKGIYDFILLNYANGDLVGHSANLEAGIKACEIVDQCVGRVVDTGLEEGYVVLVTGDHGNIESMFYPDGSPNPSHGLNPVPFILISDEPRFRSICLRQGFGLDSVAPTILALMGLQKPPEMTGVSLVSDP
jgi:2,3-bisphosphoglycerate-independent phosphoglycerate mutase